jgi:hypothetical protein
MTSFYTESKHESSNRTELTTSTCRMRPLPATSSTPTRARKPCQDRHTQNKQHSPGSGTRPLQAGLKTELMPLPRASRRTPLANAPPDYRHSKQLPQSGGSDHEDSSPIVECKPDTLALSVSRKPALILLPELTTRGPPPFKANAQKEPLAQPQPNASDYMHFGNIVAGW